MRYQPTHAAPRDSVPFVLRGPKSLRTVLSAAVAGAIGLTPAIMLTSPAQAVIADYAFEDDTVTVTEGSNLQFTVNRTANTTAAETLTWSVAGGTTNPADDDDFSPTSGTVAFAANETSKTITINTTSDTTDEENETVTLEVIDSVDDSTPLEATGTINDNDAAPGYTLVFDDASPDEGIGSVTVSAELDAPSGKDVTIPISTTNGTAKSGDELDYTALDDDTELTVAAGDTTSDSKTIAINDDEVYEDSEQTFQVVGSADASVSGTQTSTVTIVDNEEQPTITIDPDNATEGSALAFDVELSGPVEKEVTATYNTADGPGSDLDATEAADHGTATAGTDYTAVTNGTVKFTSGDVAETISVNTRTDLTDEADPEDLHVTLSSPSIVKLGDAAVATGSINDDDLAPAVTLSPAPTAFNEGNAGKTTKTYTVKLERASGQKVTVDYETVDGSAIDGEDYASAAGTLTFNPGETTKSITVDVVGDTMYEGNETFQIDMSSTSADASAAPYTVTINDDDNQPTLSISPMSMPEGNTGSVAVIPVKLSNPADTDIEIDVTATDGTAGLAAANAAPGVSDYWAPNGTTVVPAGQTTGYVYFLVNGDDVYEGNEQMTVEVEPDAGSVATGDAETATLTITNDDAAPALNVVNAAGSEGDSVQLRGLVTGIAQDDIQLNVTLKGASAEGSEAASASDFTDPGTVAVEIDGGTYPGTSIAIGTPVKLTDDSAAEPAETIEVSGGGFGAGSVRSGWLTIAAGDGYTPPAGPADPDSITLAGPPYRIGPGAIRLSGSTDPNTEVQLWSAPYNGDDDSWTEDGASTTSGSTGAFAFNRTLTATGRKYVVHAGQTVSDEVSVKLRLMPLLTASSPSRGVAYLKVTRGTPGAKFIIQRNTGSGWTAAFTGNLLSNGAYNKALAGQPSGRAVSYRAYVYGSTANGVEGGTTVARRITIR
ncbi:MAG TPA: Calx-beta domain-containing protein [Actinoplanes sp.]|nr:Calx-beta domain-containing protein [Actinoplanes sp.]